LSSSLLLSSLFIFFPFQAGIAVAQDTVATPTQEMTPSATEVPSLPRLKGLTFSGLLITELFGNVSGGTQRTVIWESLSILGMHFDFEKAVHFPGLSLNVSGLYCAGYGLTDKAVHDLNVLSNIDSYDSLRLYEAWLQQDFANGQFSIRAGQLLADAEFFVSQYSGLFVNSSFGALPVVSLNFSSPIFPIAAPGIRLRTQPNESFFLEAAAFSGNVGDPTGNNKHNLRLPFRDNDGILIFAEMGYTLNPGNAPEKGSSTDGTATKKLSGTYKLGGCFDSGEFSAGDNNPSVHRYNYAIYLLADQELWHSDSAVDRTLAFFCRLGFAPQDRNTMTAFVDSGLTLQGLLAGRENDLLGLGFSYGQLSDSLLDDLGRKVSNHNETVVELTYRLALNSHAALQPDLQCILNPGGVRPAATAIVAGLRCTLSF